MTKDKIFYESFSYRRLARIILIAFILVFILTRIIVFLIMSYGITDLFLYVRGTHVHHMNYGIFLLAGVSAFLLFRRPSEQGVAIAAAIYGTGMALTFDEFGIWLHLGGSYWQRASWDAITVLAAIFAIMAFAPSPKNLRLKTWIVAATILCATGIFFYMLLKTMTD